MKAYRSIFAGMIIGILLMAFFLVMGSSWNAQAEPGQLGREVPPSGPTAIALLNDEGDPVWSLQAGSPGDEIPPDNFALDAAVPEALPTQIPGQSLVYFFTADSDATATVVYLLNTTSVSQTVALRGYSYSGVLGYSLNIIVPAESLVRLTSDLIAAAPPPSWSTPAPIVTNFTDFTYFASLSLPKGVKAEGYTLFNPGTGTVDPRLDQGAIPLRFSTDPASVFMPAVLSSP